MEEASSQAMRRAHLPQRQEYFSFCREFAEAVQRIQAQFKPAGERLSALIKEYKATMRQGVPREDLTKF